MTRERVSLADMTDLELAQWGLSKRPPPPGVVSGRANAGIVGTAPGQPLSVFGTTFDRAVPRVLSLGGPAAFDTSTRFPPSDTEAFTAGLRGDAAWNAAVVGTKHAAAVLTYGSGASSHRVVFDWRPGTYNLPPIEAMELAVVPYGAGWAGNAGYTFAASCSPGELADAHVPTVTGTATLGGSDEASNTALANAVVAIPAGARVFDVYSKNANGYVSATPVRGQAVVHDYVSGAHVPGGLAECEWGDIALHVNGVYLVGEVNAYAPVVVGLKFFLAL